jgi:hypothetical protein
MQPSLFCRLLILILIPYRLSRIADIGYEGTGGSTENVYCCLLGCLGVGFWVLGVAFFFLSVDLLQFIKRHVLVLFDDLFVLLIDGSFVRNRIFLY